MGRLLLKPKIIVTCEYCGNQKELYNNPKQSYRFCSRACYYSWKHKNKLTEIICKTCGKKRLIKASGYERGQYKYCSQKCFLEDRKLGYKHQRGRSWNLLKAKILKRDNYLCQFCKQEKAVDTHHIIPWSKFKTKKNANNYNNLIALCKGCHRTMKGRELKFSTFLRGEVLQNGRQN